MDWDQFSTEFTEQLQIYHDYSTIPLSALHLEECLHFALKNMNEESNWNTGSHSIGYDLQVRDKKISVKGTKIFCGKRSNIKAVKCSSFRTTSHPTLEEKLKFVSDTIKSIDYNLWLLREESTDQIDYTLLKIDNTASVFNIYLYDWSEYFSKKKEPQGYRGIQPGLKCYIAKKMSDQFWFHVSDLSEFIRMDGVSIINETTIFTKDLGKRRTIENGIDYSEWNEHVSIVRENK